MAYRLVTVFGGSGFLGRYLTKRLAACGYRIRVAVRRPHLANFLQPLGTVGQIVPVQANIRDEASTARAIAGADIVVNLVGARGRSGAQAQGNINAQGARRVARLVQGAGTPHFIHVSALGASLDARSHFARSKAHGERYVREHMPSAAIMRPSIMFGPGDHFCNRIAATARFTPVIPVVDGHVPVQPVYVGDVADALARVIEQGANDGQIYELAGPQVLSMRELVALVLEEADRKRVLIPVPFKLAVAAGVVFQSLPGALVTADDVKQFSSPWVASGPLPGLAELDVCPTTLEVALPTYLGRYRRSDFEAHTAPS